MTAYTPYLSKSRFVKGLQCHKALWFQTHRPELKAEISEQQQATFDTGTEVGQLAQQLFPGGVEVPYDGLSIAEQIDRTHQLIASRVETIFEASFSFNDVFVKADILHRVGDSWRLGEVKSSTKVKDVYLNDVAVQYQVITGCGIRLESAGLVLIDTSYVRHGDIEPQKLFIWMDVSGEVLDRQQAIAAEITNHKSMLMGPEPCIDIGPHCSDPYECDFACHCWSHIPENSVFDFRDQGKPDSFELYRQGILRMEDVPGESLGWRQRMQVEYLDKPEFVIDEAAIREFLESLSWPLSFLDFETTYMTPVPLFDGTRPYQAVPFQFSRHVQEAPCGVLRHDCFLAEDNTDPRPEFVKALLESIPADGDIVVWNRAFESRIVNDLASAFPEHSTVLLALLDRMVDLMVPFRRREFYHGMMNGSYSIKAVLPALVPGFSYDDLDIASGDVAADSWLQMINSRDSDEQLKLHGNLLKYCECDTEAMVRILEIVINAVKIRGGRMSDRPIQLERLQQAIETFNAQYPRPWIGKLELSSAVKVDDESVSWPNCTKPGVYVLFNGESEVVYIGKASCNTNLGYRIGAHFYTSGKPKHDWLKDVTHVRTIPVETAHAFEAPAIEEYLIQELNPPLNVTGRRG